MPLTGVCSLNASAHFDVGVTGNDKTYLFKELYIETIIRNPKKVGLFGYR